MKSLTLLVALVTFCMVGAFAQSLQQQTKPLPPIEKKKLNLKYLGNDSSSIIERIYKNEQTSRYLQKQESNLPLVKYKKVNPEMPVMQPDSTIKHYILAPVPDSITLLHLQIKKPD